MKNTNNNFPGNGIGVPSVTSEYDYQQLIEQIASLNSEQFFANAVELLAKISKAKYAIITEILDTPACSAKTLGFWHTDKIVNNTEYDLEDTPCGKVIAGDLTFIREDVLKRFPTDRPVCADASGFLGAPIFSSDQSIIGHIVIINDKPFHQDAAWMQSIIRIFSARTGPELERHRSDSVLRLMASDLNLTSGKEYFEKLCKKVSDVLDIDFVMVSKRHELAGCDSLKTLVVYNRGRYLESFDYKLSGTPFQKLMKNQPIAFCSNVQQKFPNFELFKSINAEGYVGIPLLDASKKTIGVLNVISQKPITRIANVQHILSVFALHAAHELERNFNEEELTRYRAIADASDEFMSLIDTDYNYQAANNTYLKFFNVDRESIIGHPVHGLHGKEIFTEKIKPGLDKCLQGESVSLEFWRSSGKGKQSYICSTHIPYRDENQNIKGIVVTAKDMTLHKQSQMLNDLQLLVLKDIASNVSQQDILQTICQQIEILLGNDTMAAVFLFEQHNKHLTLAAAPKLGDYEKLYFSHAFTCHEAQSQNKHKSIRSHVYSESIDQSSIWRKYLDIIKQHRLQHSYSYPLYDQKNSLLGYFNLSFPHRAEPGQFDQTVMKIAGYLIDITLERKREEEAIIKSKKRFENLYDGTPSMFCTISKSGTIISINRFGANKLGYTVGHLLGKNISKIFHADARKNTESQIDKCFTSPDKVLDWETKGIDKNGNIIHMKVTARVVEEDSENNLLIVCEDISETYKLSQKLSHQATHDSLTGLINRREFEKRLQTIIDHCRDTSNEHVMCYLDLDQFKIINDTCGHLAGDVLLRDISEVLSMHVRKRDTLARLGGDEFGILMEHCPVDQAEKIADILRKAVEDFRFVWKQYKFSIGASIGLISINSDSGSITEILSNVDAACYAAKDAGRNRIHVYSQNDSNSDRHRGEMKWANEITEALDTDRLYLYSQKIINTNATHSKTMFSEILLRLHNKQNTIVPPGAFLPAAERYNLSTKIDRWVVDNSLKWIAQQPNLTEHSQQFSINLSGRSLYESEFLEFVESRLKQYKTPENMICFEITESAAIASLSKAIHFMKSLGELGCVFALDDFGSGVSSFTYLKNLPVDYVKIDGCYVRDMIVDPVDYAMVRSINDIAHEMGKQTIAEFVEKDSIMEKLREIGVDYAQGYSIGKPEQLMTHA